jgi:glycine/D-amino acid oxidase-like deaminating enzyme
MNDLSYWMSTVDDDLTPRPPLPGDLDVDVAIVGAGYTGLWTAYYLSRADPSVRIAVLEAEIAGYGASGRNGGWCSAMFPQSTAALARRHGRSAAIAQPEVTHTWGGPLGVASDWAASVGLDRRRGLAWAGGYVGDGVATSNLAGRTLADLIRGIHSDLTALPWVNHHSPKWTPEPLRWLGVNAGLRLMASADKSEIRTGRPSRRASLFSRLLGR